MNTNVFYLPILSERKLDEMMARHTLATVLNDMKTIVDYDTPLTHTEITIMRGLLGQALDAAVVLGIEP